MRRILVLCVAWKLLLAGGCIALLTGGVLGCKSHGERTITLEVVGTIFRWTDSTKLDEKGETTWESDVIEGSPIVHKLFGPPKPEGAKDDAGD